jgi:hypothetical protein
MLQQTLNQWDIAEITSNRGRRSAWIMASIDLSTTALKTDGRAGKLASLVQRRVSEKSNNDNATDRPQLPRARSAANCTRNSAKRCSSIALRISCISAR